jgi:acetylglutamate synthase
LLAKLIVEQVVPKESSALNERKYEIKESINSNHMDMCRFKSRADDGYKKMLFALNLYVGQIKEKMTPAAKEELVRHIMQ